MTACGRLAKRDLRELAGKRAKPSDILVLLLFDLDRYSPSVAGLLRMHGGGTRPMDLFPRACTSAAARDVLLKSDAREFFPAAAEPRAAMSGLFLYFSCLDEAHALAQDLPGVDGSYWHGIMHRMEGDAGNAEYWFHRVRKHAIYPELRSEAALLGYDWDPVRFIAFCHASAKPDADDSLARSVQLAEWQLLFDYCARAER